MPDVDFFYRARLARTDPAHFARLEEADRRRSAFAAAFGAREVRWSGHTICRLLRSTGERPGRVESFWDVSFSPYACDVEFLDRQSGRTERAFGLGHPKYPRAGHFTLPGENAPPAEIRQSW